MPELIPFTQFEFTHAIGPQAGRYVVERDGAPSQQAPHEPDQVTGTTLGRGAADVLVITLVGAPSAQPRIRRRVRAASAPGAEVPLILATYAQPGAAAPAAEAERLLAQLAGSEEAQQLRVERALSVVNRAIRGYRSGARDPYVTEVTSRDPRVTRIGFGDGGQLAAGGWTIAFELPPPRAGKAGRTARLRPGEATADVLSGRGDVLEAEELLLRVLLDLDHGRTRGAAQGLLAGLELLVAELRLGEDSPAAAAGREAAELAGVALDRELSAGEVEAIERLCESADRIIDRWRYGTSGAAARA